MRVKQLFDLECLLKLSKIYVEHIFKYIIMMGHKKSYDKLSPKVNAFIKGVSEDIIELIEESLILDVDSVNDLIKTLLRAFIMIININNFRIFNKTEIKVISSAKK